MPLSLSTLRTSHSRRRRSRALRVHNGFDRLEPRLLLAVDVLTWHNNNQRTGANLAETVLTPANVNAKSFGKLGQVQVDGQVYAQPLVKTGVAIPGLGVRDVVYVATEHDSVYAFDARTLAPLWQTNFQAPAIGVTTIPATGPVFGTGAYTTEIGITSTPVIDPASNTLYVVAATQRTDGSGIAYLHTLHALDLATGAEKLGGPVVLQASVPGTGSGSVNGSLSYDAAFQNQRPALLLDHGTVYIASASYGDVGPYHGWVLAYDAHTLHLAGAFNVTSNGEEGGIWMSGAGPAADPAGGIYLVTGNGTFDPNGQTGDFGDSVLKLAWKANGQLAPVDSFTPFNQATLASLDQDLGSGGVVLLPKMTGPHSQLLLTAGKEGRIYLLDRLNLGGYTQKDALAVQEIPLALSAAFSTPAYFRGTVYYIGTHDPGNGRATKVNALQAFTLSKGKLKLSPTNAVARFSYPGATPSVSANGTRNGIVWAVSFGNPATLLAYDAGNVRHLLYNSSSYKKRDAGGPGIKFAVPTVSNGRVYVGGNGTLTLYGLLPKRSARTASRASGGHR